LNVPACIGCPVHNYNGDGISFQQSNDVTIARCIIENNAVGQEAAGIRIREYTDDFVFKNNTICDTRRGQVQKQTVGIRIEEYVGRVALDGNKIVAKTAIDDRRSE